jgi:hypothetical protein
LSRPRCQGPDFRCGIDLGEAPEQQCIRDFVAVGEVGGELRAAGHRLGEDSRKNRFAVAIVARIGRPAAIGFELFPGACTWQAQILVLRPD